MTFGRSGRLRRGIEILARSRSLLRDRALVVAVAALLVVAVAYGVATRAPAGSGLPLDRGFDATLVVADLRGEALVLIDLACAGTLAGDPTCPAEPALRRVALPGGPHELLVLARKRIVVSLEQAGALAVVDIATGAVERIEIGGTPHGLAYMGGILLVTDRSRGAVRRFDVETWRELSTSPAGALPHAVAALPGGALAVVDAAGDMLRIGDLDVAVSARPESIAVDPVTGRIVVAGAFGGGLQVFTAQGDPLLDLAVGGRPVRVVFSPDGRRVAVALSGRGAIALVDLTGRIRSIEVGAFRTASPSIRAAVTSSSQIRRRHCQAAAPRERHDRRFVRRRRCRRGGWVAARARFVACVLPSLPARR